MTRPEDVALFIDAPTHHFDEDRLFALESPRNRDDCLLPHARVREVVAAKGVAVHTADYLLRGEDVRSCNLYVSIGRRRDWAALRQRPGVRLSAFFVTEPPVVDPAVYRALPEIAGSFRRLFTPAPAAALLPHVGTALRCEPFRLPALYDRPDPEASRRTRRGFLAMINGNKRTRSTRGALYVERLRAAAFFARTGDLDLYGWGWEDAPALMARGSRLPFRVQQIRDRLASLRHRLRPDPLVAAARRAYRGPAPNKVGVLGRYTFALAFENMTLAGWVTEKLLDCIRAGTVPVYLGAPDVAEHVPPECYVDVRQFPDYGALRTFLRELPEPAIAAYRERGRGFLTSPAFRPFSLETWVARFTRLVEEDTGSPGG